MSAARRPGRGFRIAYLVVAVPWLLIFILSSLSRNMATGELPPTVETWATIGLILLGVVMMMCLLGDGIAHTKVSPYPRLRTVSEALRLCSVATLVAYTVDLTLNFNAVHMPLSAAFIVLILVYCGFGFYVDAKEKRANRQQPQLLHSPPARP